MSLQKRLGDADSKLKAAKKELELFAELNRGLIENQKAYRDKLASADAARRNKDAQVAVCLLWCALACLPAMGALHVRVSAARVLQLQSSNLRAALQDLQEQVRDMMICIEAGQMMRSHESEMAGGSIQVAPLPPQHRRGSRKSKN